MKALCGMMPVGDGYLGTYRGRFRLRPRSVLDRFRFKDEVELSEAVSEASEMLVDSAETIILAATVRELLSCFLTSVVSSPPSSDELDKSSRLSPLSGWERSCRDGSFRFDIDCDDLNEVELCIDDEGMLLRKALKPPEPPLRFSFSAIRRSFDMTR